ncbi:unnamed protein product [Coregonus sp. 'balchen']|nr:unnamed protein product [Coregonus sp. 'balchen']
MSSFLDYSVMSGDGGSSSLRSFHSDHGITTFQSCAVNVNNCGAEKRFMPSRASPDGIPHQTWSYQTPTGSLGLAYGAHPACISGYERQGFCTTYNHYALNQEVESAAGFPQCARLMYSGNISSPMVPQHCKGYGGAPLGQLKYTHATFGGGHEQANLPPFTGCSNPLSPLYAAHLETCCSPLSDSASNSQTFDWMKVKRIPPLTWEYGYGGQPTTVRTNFTNKQLTELEKEFHFNKSLTRAQCVEIATAFQLNETQVKLWFQNRRMKQKKRKKEGLLPNKAPASDPGDSCLVKADDAESEKSLSAPSTPSPTFSTVSSGVDPYSSS